MYPSSPFEYKRLEYQLRIDAAAKCPGTVEADNAPESPTDGLRVTASLVARLSQAIHGLTSLLNVRGRAKAQ
jgi:hypothetical protein